MTIILISLLIVMLIIATMLTFDIAFAEIVTALIIISIPPFIFLLLAAWFLDWRL